MKVKHLMMVVGTSSAALCLNSCSTNVDGNAHYTDEDKDLTVEAGNDFYQYSNGGWMARQELPADKSRLGTFDLLNDENVDRLKAIITEVTSKQNEMGTPAQKIADLYNCGIDTAKRDLDGIKALEPYMQIIDATENHVALAKTIANLQEIGSSNFFVVGQEPDAMNSSQTICVLWQSGLGLPDRDYYFNNDEKAEKIKAGYKEMLTKFAEQLGWENIEERVANIYALEEKMADKFYTRKQNRDPQSIYNKMTFAELKAKAVNFDWDTYFATLNLQTDEINAAQVNYFAEMGELINSTDMATIRDYMKIKLVRTYASDASTTLENISFDFYGKTLSGVQEMKPLWKRVLGTVEDVCGEQLGQLFVEKYFPPQAKQRMINLIENLRIAFAQRIDNLTWMGDSTKIQAKEKLNAITVKVGYPDKWNDYTKLTIDKNISYVANLINASKFAFAKELAKIGKPVDKAEWFMTPQTVNAYYNPSANEIVFPAGILQPPFFYAEGDDAVNYGAIGVVIGHEMTHGFDDQGCQFDKDGNLNNWWTSEDSEKFAQATTRLAERFSSFTVIGDLHANGELTLGENIADLGGLNISYQAFRNAQNGVEPAPIDGQTAAQRFCYAYSRVWAQNIREDALYQQVKTDPHSPGKLRVNGPLPLVDFFYDAFGVTEKDSMYVPVENRIVIW